MYPEHVETAHLRGDRITDAVWLQLRELHQNADTMRTMAGVRDVPRSRALLDLFEEDWRRDGFGLWWLWELASGASLGHGGLRRARVDDADEVEMANALLPDFWGRGYATEVARLSVGLAFDEMHLPSVVAYTATTNWASQRVIEKSGFHFEKAIRHAGLPHLLYRQIPPER